MNRLAFDIVLLLPNHIKKQAIEANQRFCLKNHPISFYDGSRLPHISLAMGVVKQDDLDDIRAVLKTLADQTKPLTLQISRQYNEPIQTGETVLGFEIGLTNALQALHELIMQKLKAYVFYDATISELFDLNAEPQTIDWINGFKKNSSVKKFWPHITIGISSDQCEFPSEPFLISELAIFHTGTYCTCPRDGQIGRWVLHQ